MSWQERVAGDRLHVDREFADRVRDSDLSNQQWGLVMTAVELDVEHAADPERARLVADTSALPHVMDAVANAGEYPGMAAGGGTSGRSDGGLLGSLRRALGLGGGGDDALREEAERLAEAYAEALETRLRERGRWEDVRSTAAESDPDERR